MLTAPVWAYLLGILLALPVFVLILGLGVVMIRLFAQWLANDGSAPGPRTAGGPKGKATLKG